MSAWVVLVAQEFVIEADDANAALAFARAAQSRVIEGATLIDARSVTGPMRVDPSGKEQP